MTFVTGPASAFDNYIALFDGTTGDLIKCSVTSIDATGFMSTYCAGAETLKVYDGSLQSNTGYLLWSGGTGYAGITICDSITVVANSGTISAPVFSGGSITQSAHDNSTKIATTAYVDAAVAAGGGATATTVQYLTSGSSATYTTPAGCLAIRVAMVGAGGGGGAYVTNTGSAGGDSIFNSIHAKGGSGGGLGQGGSGGAGGTGGSGSASLRIAGAKGDSAYFNGGMGGATPFGGGGSGGITGGTIAGVAGASNTGAGGGGGSSGGNAATGGAGGGAGEYAEIYISSPSSTYTYTIGTGGAGGTDSVSRNGAAGGSGLMVVTEYY